MNYKPLTAKAAKAAYLRREISTPFYMNGGLYFTYIAGPDRGEDGYIVTANGTFKQYRNREAASTALDKITGDQLDKDIL